MTTSKQIFKLSRTSKGLIALSILCGAMSVSRLIIAENLFYIFLSFNLVLAWVPYLLSAGVLNIHQKNKLLTYLTLVAWFLFIPNAPYIITDLLHFKNYSQDILWFDVLLVFMYGLTGLLLGANSLTMAQEALSNLFNQYWALAIVILLILLSGFGIYLGRYCRLNSWDVFNRPIWFYGRVISQFSNPLMYKVTATYSLVLLVAYGVFVKYFKSEQQS